MAYDDFEDRVTKRQQQRRRRNLVAKALRDQSEHKGAFALKVIPPKRERYRREKIRMDQIYENDEDAN